MQYYRGGHKYIREMFRNVHGGKNSKSKLCRLERKKMPNIREKEIGI